MYSPVQTLFLVGVVLLGPVANLLVLSLLKQPPAAYLSFKIK